MSPFTLSKNAAELADHMKGYLEYINSQGNFYTYFPMEFKDCSYEEGWVEFKHKAEDFDSNRYGTVHGGVLGLFLDTAMGLAAYETGTGNPAPTMDLHTTYLRPMLPGDELVIRAEVMSAGKRTCMLRAFVIVDGDIKVMATSTCRIYSDTKPKDPALDD